MQTARLMVVLLTGGLVLDCLAAPFTFPENDQRGRSISEVGYDDYDSRIHHGHNGQHQHHGGFNKRKKLKKKRRKRPCYYKTSDGRTLFWTGLNIYETNIYVNQGGHTQGDPAAGPCENDTDDGPQLPDFSQDSGVQQSPQRPNRPILQGLASYIPSGPGVWQWAQGVQWSNYVPNQQSFNSALNTVVNSLPGFGYRPRPPVPVRPVTESPFTQRPTDFTRPPTFTRPTQPPVITRPTQQPIVIRPTPQTTTRPTQRPIFTRPTSQKPPSTTGEGGSDENYDYSNFSSENNDNSADTSFNGLGSASNQPISHIPTVGSIGNGIKPVYERPGKYFNDYVVKPIRFSIRELTSWF